MSPLTPPHLSRNTVYVLIVILIAILGSIGISFYRTSKVNEESNRKWCGVLRVYHDASATGPAPTTPSGRAILAELNRLYIEFHCDRVPGPQN